jgi:hypothetical protein
MLEPTSQLRKSTSSQPSELGYRNEGLYVGEDPNEVFGAQRAGMANLVKPISGVG